MSTCMRHSHHTPSAPAAALDPTNLADQASQLVAAQTRQESQWTLRAARLDDRERLIRLYDRLSPQTIYYRLFLPAPHGPDWAARFAALALGAVASHQQSASAALEPAPGSLTLVALLDDRSEIIGTAQYGPSDEQAHGAAPREAVAEIAFVVEDAWQGRGVGGSLLRAVLRQSRADGYQAVRCHVLAENRRAQRFVTTRLMQITKHLEDGVYDYYARLDAQAVSEPAAPPLDMRQTADGVAQPSLT